MHMRCRRWTRWESCMLSLVLLLLICSLNHYQRHLSRDVCIESVWWDLKRCKVQGEKLHKLVAKISIPMIEYSTWWLSGLYTFSLEWVFLMFLTRGFWRGNSCNITTYTVCSFFIFFPLGFSEFWGMDIRIITQGGVLGNRATREGGGGRVQSAWAGPSRFPSLR